MGRTELLTCLATQNSFGKIRDQAQQVSKKFEADHVEKYIHDKMRKHQIYLSRSFPIFYSLLENTIYNVAVCIILS